MPRTQPYPVLVYPDTSSANFDPATDPAMCLWVGAAVSPADAVAKAEEWFDGAYLHLKGEGREYCPLPPVKDGVIAACGWVSAPPSPPPPPPPAPPPARPVDLGDLGTHTPTVNPHGGYRWFRGVNHLPAPEVLPPDVFDRLVRGDIFGLVGGFVGRDYDRESDAALDAREAAGLLPSSVTRATPHQEPVGPAPTGTGG